MRLNANAALSALFAHRAGIVDFIRIILPVIRRAPICLNVNPDTSMSAAVRGIPERSAICCGDADAALRDADAALKFSRDIRGINARTRKRPRGLG